jgi:hypothetical protein
MSTPKTESSNNGVLPRKEEVKLVKHGLKKEVTHPKEEPQKKNEDPNGMTAKTLSKMKKKLHEVPHKSAATEHDGAAYKNE